MNVPPNEDHFSDEDEYIEKVIKKQFNNRLGQYEFLVKWKDHSASTTHGN